MRNPDVESFETQLKNLFDVIDGEMEDRWGSRYYLHPDRPERGATTNKELDGLFNIGAAFTAGYGSEHGRGYAVEIRMVTLNTIEKSVLEEIREYCSRRIIELLPKYFPDRELELVRDESTFKIVGDLSL